MAADPLESLLALESAVATSGSLFGDALRDRLPSAGPIVASKFKLQAWLRALDDDVAAAASSTTCPPTTTALVAPAAPTPVATPSPVATPAPMATPAPTATPAPAARYHIVSHA